VKSTQACTQMRMPNELEPGEILSAIQSLSAKARSHRQAASVIDVLVEELEDSLHGGA
jgi:hypothetical protein